MRFLLLLVGIFCIRLVVVAQLTSPVSSSLVLGRPYSLRLSDYVEPGTSRVSATLLLASDPSDPTVDRVQVRLRLVIENNSIRISTREGFLPSTPLFLTEGVPELLDASDLAPYFDLRNLDFVGLDKAVYQQTSRLPEGFYTFRLEVYEYFRGSKLGGLSPSATGWLMLNDPPRWVWPSSPGQRPTATEPQNLQLQWLPMHTGSPNALSGVSYELTMVELWPREDQDPNEALNSLSPFYKVEDIQTNSLILGPDAPQLVPGRKYALRLRVTEAAGLSLFRNNGYSEVTYFTFGEPCLSPSVPVSRVRSSREAEVSWSPLTNHSGFRVRYREPGQENWYTQSATNASAILSQLNAGRTYEYTIQPQCGTLQGPETPPATFVTPNPTVSGPDCGTSTSGTNLRNSPLRTTLTPGEEYTSGKHVLVVDNYTPSTNGSFRGVGKMRFGFISGLPFAVEFTGLKVGTDNEIKDGDIKTIIYGVYVIDERTLAQAQAALDYASTLLQGTPPSAQSLAKLQDTLRSIRNLPPSVVAAVQQGIQTIAAGNTNAGQKQVSDALKQASTDLARSINKGGNVIGGGGGNRGKELLPLPGLAVTFSPHTDTRYGFDAPGYVSIANTYGQENGIPIAWKALESGQSDPLRVTISVSGTRYKRDSVTFGTQNGGKLTLVQNKINPSGGADGSTTEVYALYPTTGGGTRNIAQVNSVSYDKVVKTVVVIPLGTALPVSSQVLTDSLNRIFGQAVAGFTVEVKPVFKSGWTGTISIGGTGMLAAYTQSQRDIITEYKNANRDISSTKYYVFVGGTPSDPQVQGYMPRARRFGFIFDRTTTAKTLAHELGHGVFHLQHAFDEKQLDRTGDNLMSYGNGTRLHKYQWDKVHNPELVLGILEDDEDGMAKVEKKDFILMYGTSSITNGDIIVSKAHEKIKVKFSSLQTGKAKMRIEFDSEKKGVANTLFPKDSTAKVDYNTQWETEITTDFHGKYTVYVILPTETLTKTFYVKKSEYSCLKCGRNLKLNLDTLIEIFPNNRVLTQSDVDIFNAALITGGFCTCKRMAHFFAQVKHESKDFTELEEDASYSLKGVLNTYKSKTSLGSFFKQSFWDNKTYLDYFHYDVYETDPDGQFESKTVTTFKWASGNATNGDTIRIPISFKPKTSGGFKKNIYAKDIKSTKNKKLFSYIYSNNFGNRGPETEDGWNYRGKGAIHLTWRENYQKVSAITNKIFGTNYNWEVNFDQPLVDKAAAVRSAIGYFHYRLNSNISSLDANDITTVSFQVNGGYIGLEERKDAFELTKSIFEINECK